MRNNKHLLRAAAVILAAAVCTGCSQINESSDTVSSQQETVSQSETTVSTTSEEEWMKVLPYYLSNFRTNSSAHGFYHPVAMHLLDTWPSADDPEIPAEKTIFLCLQRTQNAADCAAVIFEEGKGEIKCVSCAGAAHCSERQFWCASTDGTVQIWNYDLVLCHTLSLKECSVISVNLSAELVYGVDAVGNVSVCGYDGVLSSVCQLSGITVTALHACDCELLFVGQTEAGACCGRISLSDGSYSCNMRNDGGRYFMREFNGGAIITDGDRYDETQWTGQIRYWKNGEEKIIALQYPCESACAFALPDGDAILTSHLTFQESNSSILTWITMYSAKDGEALWSVWYAQSHTDVSDLIQHDKAYLTDRVDIDNMMFLEGIETVWCECAYSLDRFSYTEKSIRYLSQ